nr:hypothetical protein [Bacteroidota bacterium]
MKKVTFFLVAMLFMATFVFAQTATDNKKPQQDRRFRQATSLTNSLQQSARQGQSFPRLSPDKESKGHNFINKYFANTELSGCNYTLIAYSEFPWGWDGCTLTITEDGVPILENYTLLGMGPEITEFEVTDGSLLVAIFNPSSWFPEDCSYEILDINGNVVFSDGMYFSVPTGGEIGMANCTPVFYDAVTVSIDVPEAMPLGIIMPVAVVKNAGFETITFNVQMTIGTGYTSIRTVTNLDFAETTEVEFDAWNAVLGTHAIEVCTLLPDDEIPENDCLDKAVDVLEPNYFYAYNAWDPSGVLPEGPISFFSATPYTTSLIAPTTSSDFIAGACWANRTWYGCQWGGGLYSIDEFSGAMTYIGFTPAFNGLAYDDVNGIMYGASYTELYEVDPATGTCTFIGDIGGGGNITSIACNPDGQLYGIGTGNDDLYMIDGATGAITAVIPLDIYLDQAAQDMAWDKDNDILYFATWIEGGKLYT